MGLEMNETKKALGKKSRLLKRENRALIYMTIAKEPSSFSELLEKTKLSRSVLTQHLKELENEGLIYKDIIKPTETLDKSQIGKIVYKIKEDEMENFLMQTIHMNFTIAELVEDENLRQKLNEYAKEIAKAIIQYVNQLRASREQSLKAELERTKRSDVECEPRFRKLS
jgi:DNA-binding transcriptional ArsR family regulator